MTFREALFSYLEAREEETVACQKANDARKTLDELSKKFLASEAIYVVQKYGNYGETRVVRTNDEGMIIAIDEVGDISDEEEAPKATPPATAPLIDLKDIPF